MAVSIASGSEGGARTERREAKEGSLTNRKDETGMAEEWKRIRRERKVFRFFE